MKSASRMNDLNLRDLRNYEADQLAPAKGFLTWSAVGAFLLLILGLVAANDEADFWEREAEEKLARVARAAAVPAPTLIEREHPDYEPQRKLSFPLRCPDQWISTQADGGRVRLRCVMVAM